MVTSKEITAALIGLEVEVKNSMLIADALEFHRPAKATHACEQIQDHMAKAAAKSSASEIHSRDEAAIGHRDLQSDQ